MRTRSQVRKRRQQQVRQTSVEPPNLEKPNNNQELFNPPIVTMADNRTMAQLLEAPTEGYEDAIVVPEITANNFEIKHGLLNLVQNKQFFGHDKEDPHAHIRYFNKITSTMKSVKKLYSNVMQDLILSPKFIDLVEASTSSVAAVKETTIRQNISKPKEALVVPEMCINLLLLLKVNAARSINKYKGDLKLRGRLESVSFMEDKFKDVQDVQGKIVGIKRLLNDLRVTAAKLMLLVYKLLLLVLKVNAASTKVTTAQRLRLLVQKLLSEKG
ncbi:hypothetical protein Tco_0261284 [Tanacetum coccineum]